MDVPVSTGELVLYAGVGTGDLGSVRMILTTALKAPGS